MSDRTDSLQPDDEPTLPPIESEHRTRRQDDGRGADAVEEVTLGPARSEHPLIHQDDTDRLDNVTLPPNQHADSDNDDLTDGQTVWKSGSTIRYFGDYELLSEIARGGMGVVFKARQVNLNRIVALKMILAGQLAGDEEVQRFHAEAEAAANLDHPGIVPIYEVGHVDGQHYFSMGFVNGDSLADRLTDGPLSPRRAAEVMRKICDAMAYAHESGVIHRDLKPANILMDVGDQPRVTDFGLAKKVEGGSDLTNTGQVLGTPSYMPPEQAAGKTDQIDARADVYSLGGILYALGTGRPPFQAASPLDTLMQVLEKEPVPPRQFNPAMDEDLQTICLKCLEKNPESRYSTSRELVEELDRYLTGEPIIARPIGRAQRVWRWCKRKPAAAGLLAVASLLLVVLSIGGPMMAFQQAEFAAEQVKLKTDAVAARDVANKRTQEAEAARKKVVQEQKRVDGLLYSTRISLAYREWSDGNPNRAQQLLNDCPRERRNWEWHYIDGLLRAEVLSLFAHKVPGDVQFLSNGESLVTRGVADNQLKKWDLSTGLETQTLEIDNLRQFDMTDDHEHGLVVAGNSVRYINIETGESESYGDFGVRATNGSLFDGGNRVAAAFADGTVTLYRRGDTKELFRVPKKLKSDLPLCFSPTGRVAAGTQGSTVFVWDVRTGDVKFEIQGHIKLVSWLAFSPDGSLLASVGGGGKLMVTNVESGQRRHFIQAHGSSIEDVVFSDDGQRIATASLDRTCRVFDLVSGSRLLTIQGHAGGLLAVDFDPTGKRVATASTDGSVRVWNIDDQLAMSDEVADTLRTQKIAHLGHEIGLDSRVFYGHLRPAYNLAISPDGRYATTTAFGSTSALDKDPVKVWSLGDKSVHASFPVEGGILHTTSYSADSKQLIVASGGAGDAVSQSWITIWDLEKKQRVRALDGIACMFVRALVNERGNRLVVAYGNLNYSKLRFYSYPDGELVSEQDIPKERLSSIAFSASGDRLLSSGAPGGMIRVWDVESGKQVDDFRAHGSGVFQIAVSTDDKLATANLDGRIGIWDWKRKQQLGELRGHATCAVDVAFSPDGKRLLSSSEDETLKIWDLTSFNELLSFRDHTTAVLGADWSQDGKTIASVSRDGAMILRGLRERATARLEEWVTVFKDDFERTDPGPKWDGGAKIKNGKLVGTQSKVDAGGFSFPASFLSLSGVDLPRTVEISADVKLNQPMLVQFVMGNLQTQQYLSPLVASTSQPYSFTGSAVVVARGAETDQRLLGSRTADRLEVGRTYRFRVLRDVDDLKFFLDDRLIEHARVPTMEADQLTLGSGWSKVNDEIEFDNVVIRIPPEAVHEQEVRGQIKRWLSEALVPEAVAALITSRFDDAEERELAQQALKSLGAGKKVDPKILLSAIEAVVLRDDATPHQYEIAALQADHYLKTTPGQWWHWSKPAMAWFRAGRFEQSLEQFDRSLAKWDEKDRHPDLLGLAGRALALAALDRNDEAQQVHARVADLARSWRPNWLTQLRKELQEKAPLKPDPERDQVLSVLIQHVQDLWHRGDVKKAFANVGESFVAVQARTAEPSPYDVVMDRTAFAQFQATQYSSNPPPRLHVFWDEMNVKFHNNRASVSWVEIAKFQEMTFRYQCEHELEKQDGTWRIIKRRHWGLDWRTNYEWKESGPAQYAARDKKIARLQEANSPELADALLGAARFNEAYELTSQLAVSRPDDAENLVMLGEAAINVGRIREGIDALARARFIDPAVEMPWFLTRIEANFSQHRSRPFGVDVNAETNQMITAHRDRTLVLWDLQKVKVIRKLESAHRKAIVDVAYLHDGKRIVSAGSDNVVNVFDLSTGNRIGQLSGHLGVVWRIDLHPTKNIVITTSTDGTAKIWDVDQGQELVTLSGHTRAVFGAAFNPDAARAATASLDGTLRIWDTATGKELKKIDAHQDGALRVDWTPDGDRILSCGRDKTVRVWDSKSYDQIVALDGHTEFINVVRVSPDGKLAASGDEAGEIWIWDLETLKPVTVLRSYSSLSDLRFLDQSLLSVHDDEVTRRWDVDFLTPFLAKKIKQIEGL